MMSAVEFFDVVCADLLTLDVVAFVIAAIVCLLGGGGVDGAIHRAAGPGLLAECEGLGGCPTGDAKITAGYNLPARHIIHTVGPIYRDGTRGEPELLVSCYRNSLALAVANDVRTIAFPAISCGIYGYPLADACTIASREVTAFVETGEVIDKVIFCCFSADIKAAYEQVIKA